MIDLDTIHTMWAQDAILDEKALDVSSAAGSKLHAKYLQLFNVARLFLRKREGQLSKLKKDKWRYFTGKMLAPEMEDLGWDYDPFGGLSKPLKGDLHYYIDADDDVIALDLKVHYSKILVETIEEILGNLRWRSTAIKNMIEWHKFQSGC